MQIVPTGGALAADITDIDLSQPLSTETVAAISQAWADHLVLRFRNQKMSDDALMEFSANFGALDKRPVGKADQNSQPGNHYVTIISNVVENGKPIGGLGNLESKWHTDMSYNPSPAIGSILHALEIPPSGGNTGFCNMYMAWENLDPDLKARVKGLKIKHDAAHTSVGGLRPGFGDAIDPMQAPGALHPAVRVHPVTGKESLYLGRRQDAYIEGLSIADSEALLDEIWDASTKAEYCWDQIWQVGDVVMWDNRCVLHRRDGFDNSARRVMHRTQIGGDQVTAAYA